MTGGVDGWIDREELEAERLGLLDQSVQLGLIDDLADEDRVARLA